MKLAGRQERRKPSSLFWNEAYHSRPPTLQLRILQSQTAFPPDIYFQVCYRGKNKGLSQGCLNQKGQWLVDETDKINSHRQRKRSEKRRQAWAGKDPSHRSKNNAWKHPKSLLWGQSTCAFTHAQNYPDGKSL